MNPNEFKMFTQQKNARGTQETALWRTTVKTAIIMLNILN